MFFTYQCPKCSNKFDEEFPIGKATRTRKCPSCEGRAKRVFEGTSISLKIGGMFTHSGSFGEQMKNRNLQAAHRMKGRKAPVRLSAMDYGNGDIRELKKKAPE